MQLFLVIATILITTYRNVDGQNTCTTPNGSPGQCVRWSDCPALTALVSKPNRTETKELIRKSQCGFQGKDIRVCCPEPCFTPDGKEGECMNIRMCQHLMELLKTNLQNSTVPQHVVNFVNNSRCQNNDKYSVCCGPAFKTFNQPQAGRCTASPLPPDPSTKCCGDDDIPEKIFISEEEKTGIDEYPWISLIEYKRGNKTKLLCGGSLISARYVLTAGHCVAGEVLNYGTPVNVRLSEYDLSNDGIDCTRVGNSEQDCNMGTTVIPIEETVVHPEYDPYHSQRRHDIALIRMKTLAPYTDFIRPICLPTTDLTALAPPAYRYKFHAAGWGNYNSASLSKVKLQVELPYVNITTCQSAYKKPKRNVTLWKGHICAGGEAKNDTCKGDSGGPLMHRNSEIFEVIGVVSFGQVLCGQGNVPGVYTKVFEYLPWMKSVMRA